MRRAIIDIDSGHVFACAGEAAAYCGLHRTSIRNAIVRVTRAGGRRWAWLGSEGWQRLLYERKSIMGPAAPCPTAAILRCNRPYRAQTELRVG